MSHSLLSDKAILRNLSSGSIIIEPFKKENLSTSSYDVCLGNYFFRETVPQSKRLKKNGICATSIASYTKERKQNQEQQEKQKTKDKSQELEEKQKHKFREARTIKLDTFSAKTETNAQVNLHTFVPTITDPHKQYKVTVPVIDSEETNVIWKEEEEEDEEEDEEEKEKENEEEEELIYNPYSKKMVGRIWGDAEEAELVADWMARTGKKLENVFPSDRVIWIHPGETILGHTEEFIGGRNTITTMMKARSSMGRNFIEVCKCAGWGDIGYINKWTMEITNNSRYYKIPLVVGRRIAQIVFFDTEGTAEDYANLGKYQLSKCINELKSQWTPLSCLPKMYLDREVSLLSKLPLESDSNLSKGINQDK